MPKLDLSGAKSIKIETRNLHGDIKIQYAPITQLEYAEPELEIKTVWNSDNKNVTIYLSYEKGDFCQSFFLSQKHSVKYRLIYT